MTHFKTGVATIDRNLQIVRADQNFYQFIGWENPIVLEQSVFKEDFPKLKTAMESVFATGERMVETYRVLRQDESLHWVVADITMNELKEQGEFVCLNIQSIDMLEQELSKMSDEVRQLDAYLDIMDEIFFRYNAEENSFCLFMSSGGQRIRLFGGSFDVWEKSFVEGHSLTEKNLDTFKRFCADVRQGTRSFSHEVMMANLARGDGKELYLLKGKAISDIDGKPLVLGCVYTLAKDSRRRKSRLGADAAKDEMTGLLSKKTIADYIQNFMETKSGGTSYLCVLDVDNFKGVNDNYGHLFGDEVLMTVADILKDAVGDRGVVGRIGGDEMLIFLEDIIDRVDLKSILRTIRINVEWAYKGVRDDLHLSCSIGAAAWPTDADNYNDLFKIADKMLYRAKEGGKNRYIIYTQGVHPNPLAGDAPVPVTPMKQQNVTINKERLLLELTENFLHRGMWGVKSVLEQTGLAFSLVETDVFYDEPVYTAMHWRADGKPLENGRLDYADNTKFRQLFDENNLAVINHTADLEFLCPEAYASLSAQHVTAALIYRMNGKVAGHVVFYKEESASRMWTESDKMYLNLIGKMIELVLGGR
ncbi:MAG: GGDEF domain-containing protein [Acetatifactor sp.]|nr:GGDEF domain-containing protein [Acetatifactor sp.]